MLKHIVIVSLLVVLQVTAIGQQCVVQGCVHDEEGTPIEYASVTIANDSAYIGGSITNAKGEFVLQLTKNERPCHITVSCVGKVTLRMTLVPNAKTITLDTLVLKNSAFSIKEISVSASRTPQPTVEHTIVAPQSVITNMKGSVLDVLKEVPSVTVDNDNNVYVRGNSNVLVLVNGMPTTMTALAAVPSADIAGIEIITSPDASYDAEGTGGIINLVLKEVKTKGCSGMVSVNYGFNHFTNANIAINYAKNNMSFRFNYNMKYEDDNIKGTLNREFVGKNYELYQQFNSQRTIFNNNIGLGASFRINPYNNLNVNIRLFLPRISTIQHFENIYSIDHIRREENRGSNVIWNRENIDAGLVYTHVIKPQLSDVTLRASVSKIWGHRPSLYYVESDSVGKSHSGGSPLNTSVQCDVKIMRTYGKWDAGLKFVYRQNDIYHDFYDYIHNNWIYSPVYSNDLLHKEFIPAAYVMFSSLSNKPLVWKIGIRGEYSRVKLQNKKDALDTAYYHVYVGPGFMLNYKIVSKRSPVKQHIAFAYNSRISRPAYPQLNPYMSMIDAHTFEQGNMCLHPETSSHVEFMYALSSHMVNFTTAVYATYIANNITQVAMLKDSILLLTYVNGTHDFKTGIDVSFGLTPCSWYNMSLSANTYYVAVTGNIKGVDFDNSGWVNSSNIKLVFHPIKSMNIQAQYFIETPQYYPQFTTQFSHHCDVGISQKFLKGSLTVSLLVTDIFNTNTWNIYSNNRIYHLTNTSKNKSRMLWIGIQYNFNAYKPHDVMKSTETDRSKVRLGL